MLPVLFIASGDNLRIPSGVRYCVSWQTGNIISQEHAPIQVGRFEKLHSSKILASRYQTTQCYIFNNLSWTHVFTFWFKTANFVNVRGFFFWYGLQYKQKHWVGGCTQACTIPCGQHLYNCKLLQFSAGLIINIIQKYIINPTTIYHNMKDRNVIKWVHLIFHTYSMPEAPYLIEVAKKARAFLLCTLYGS